MAESERSVRVDIEDALKNRRDVVLFSNPRGVAYLGKVIRSGDGSQVTIKYPRRVEYGLYAGASDKIGWKTIEITPDMVGKKVAVFVAMEVKAPGKEDIISADQIIFLENVKKAGGMAAKIVSVEEMNLFLK